MSLAVVGSYSLLELNVAAAAGLTVFLPVLAQFDLSLTGPFGIGALQLDISSQFNAALSVSVQLSAEISNPIAGLQATLQALAQLEASIQATLLLQLPSLPSPELGISLSAQAAVMGALGAKISGMTALIEASLAVKAAALNYIGSLQGALSAGPIFLLSLDGSLATAGADVAAAFGGGLLDITNSNHIAPGDAVHGVVLVTKNPSAWAAIQATLRTA